MGFPYFTYHRHREESPNDVVYRPLSDIAETRFSHSSIMSPFRLALSCTLIATDPAPHLLARASPSPFLKPEPSHSKAIVPPERLAIDKYPRGAEDAPRNRALAMTAS